MTAKTLLSAFAILAGLSAATPAAAQATEEFYKGKTIQFIIGYAAGSGYDLYARLLTRHMGRHIPGNPTMIAQNMPGAGSLQAANYLYEVAPKDGTHIGMISRG